MVQHYLSGIQFVLQYYYCGCPDWAWYYPYYYAPMLSDLFFLVKKFPANTIFTMNPPFTPYMQLLAVLPPQSASLLPKEIGNYLVDPESPLNQNNLCP